MTTGYVEKYRISIQVFLNGYSYKITDTDGRTVSEKDFCEIEELYSSRIFSYPYKEYRISYRTHRCTLIPAGLMPDTGNADKDEVLRNLLAEYDRPEENEKVECTRITPADAVLVYAMPGEGSPLRAILSSLPSDCRPFPEMYWMLEELYGLPCHNRVIASYRDSLLSLAIAEDGKLLLCNSFNAQDFTTAMYFIFSALKQFQINPEVTTIYFRENLGHDQEMLLYRYFSGVEILK